MNLNFNPRWVVYATMVAPVIYVFMELEWSPFLLAAVAVGGIMFFHDNFVHKGEVRQHEPVEIGKQEPFMDNRYKEARAGEPPTVKYQFKKYPPGS